MTQPPIVDPRQAAGLAAAADDTKTISVRLPGDLSRKIEAASRVRGETLSDLLRRAIETELSPPAPVPIVYMAAGMSSGAVVFHLGPGLLPSGQYLASSPRWESNGGLSTIDIWVGDPLVGTLV